MDNSEEVGGVFHDAFLPLEGSIGCGRRGGQAMQASFGRSSGWSESDRGHHLAQEPQPQRPRARLRPRSASPRHTQAAAQRRVAEAAAGPVERRRRQRAQGALADDMLLIITGELLASPRAMVDKVVGETENDKVKAQSQKPHNVDATSQKRKKLADVDASSEESVDVDKVVDKTNNDKDDEAQSQKPHNVDAPTSQKAKKPVDVDSSSEELVDEEMVEVCGGKHVSVVDFDKMVMSMVNKKSYIVHVCVCVL